MQFIWTLRSKGELSIVWLSFKKLHYNVIFVTLVNERQRIKLWRGQSNGLHTETRNQSPFLSLSQWGFDPDSGARPGAAKVMVVVTDGESHDVALRENTIAECEKKGITRFAIAVSPEPRGLGSRPAVVDTSVLKLSAFRQQSDWPFDRSEWGL